MIMTLWDTNDLKDYFKVKKTTLYVKLLNRPDFPKPITIPGVRRRWKPDDIMKWVDGKQD